jgi:hypothetical protein
MIIKGENCGRGDGRDEALVTVAVVMEKANATAMVRLTMRRVLEVARGGEVLGGG